MKQKPTSLIVTIYSTPWCAFCKSEMAYLTKAGVDYIDKDIEADKSAYNELLKKNGGSFLGVPVTDIDGELVVGFDRPAIDALLKKHQLI